VTATPAQLLRDASAGSEGAWEAIVERFSGLVWSTTRAHRLSPAEAADVVQTTWLRLVENLDRLDDPARVGAWLATTARRESLRQLRLRARELPTEDEWMFDGASDESVEHGLITRERDAAVRRALAALDERCQALLRILAAPEPPSYEEIGAALGMPVGAIGPTRGRCLDKLRRQLERIAT
jgi:RNA polymerase sigma factor (sigma-70 family)